MTLITTTSLVWKEIAPRYFELRAGNEILATLRWAKAFGALAFGESNARTVTFKRISLFGPRVRIRDSETNAELALLGQASVDEPEILKLSTGECFLLVPIGESGISFQDTENNTILTLYTTNGAREETVAVNASEKWANMPAFLLLAMLGLYVLELQREDELAATMAATTLLHVS
jgi:hypothetical protein